MVKDKINHVQEVQEHYLQDKQYKIELMTVV